MSKIVAGAESELHAVRAMVLYGTSAQEIKYATVHDISIDDDTRVPKLGAGAPIDRIALTDALASLSREVTTKAEFVTPNVLSIGQHSIAWWCPSAPRRVFFNCGELGVRNERVPHPSLVFHASHGGFRVFALADDRRPDPSTPLFEPPYFNTWNAGKICIGSARVPDCIDVASIDGWESGFFDSAFTHPNHGGKRVADKDGEFAFWKAMLDGKFAEFPRELLIPMKRTLGDLIAGKLESQ
ncbi:PRTRC system protein B (plasmid) [Pararobbsia alpina]|uniref:PRTRC system protein B n=1 Tax=Pararobbsia alpina TaxID=621374 RepID=UPI0039A45ABC